MGILLLTPAASIAASINNSTEAPTDAPTEAPSEGCPHHDCVEDGLFPEGDCSPDFCQCEHGIEHPMACMQGLFFNPVTGVCDWAWNNPGCDDPTEEPTEEPTEKPTEKPTEEPTEEPQRNLLRNLLRNPQRSLLMNLLRYLLRSLQRNPLRNLNCNETSKSKAINFKLLAV